MLELINSGQAGSLEEMASKLKTDVSALEGPLKLLLSKGYLKLESRDSNANSKKCLMCSSRQSCDKDVAAKAYVITEKGKGYIGKE